MQMKRDDKIQNLRGKQRNRPILDVYLAAIPDDLVPGPVFPPEREAWISASGNPSVRRERYAVWKLLERGVFRSFGLRMEELHFTEQAGKWSCDRLYFSLSHCAGLAAAAVSDAPVGVDAESAEGFAARAWDKTTLERMARRVCTPEEQEAARSPEGFLRLWTKKECIFKCCGSGGFLSRQIDTAAYHTLTWRTEEPTPCVLSVCGERLEQVRLFLAEKESLRPLFVGAVDGTDAADPQEVCP